MDPIFLFDLATRRSEWLSVRQEAIATNIANIDTPAFKTQDVVPFSETLQKTQLQMAATAPGHMADRAGSVRVSQTRAAAGWERMHSGNDVSVERELIKAGQVTEAYSLNTAIVKTFHRMLLASVR